MAGPTLQDANDYLTTLLEETDSGGLFGTAARYRAIYMIVNRIQLVTHRYQATFTGTVSNGTTSYDLSGGSWANSDNFDVARLEDLRIGNHPAMTQEDSEDRIRDYLRSGASGRPLSYFPVSRTAILIDRDPDEDYDVTGRWYPEIPIDFFESKPSGVSLQLPEMWVYGGLDVGAQYYLTRTRKEFNYGSPANAEFERWLIELTAREVRPVICFPDASYGVYNGVEFGGH